MQQHLGKEYEQFPYETIYSSHAETSFTHVFPLVMRPRWYALCCDFQCIHGFVPRRWHVTPLAVTSSYRSRVHNACQQAVDQVELLWYGLGRPVITSEIGNWSVFVLLGWRFVFGIIIKRGGREHHIVRCHHDSGNNKTVSVTSSEI